MEKSHNSLARVIIGLGLIIGCFVWTIYIFSSLTDLFQQFAQNRLLIWLDIVIAGLFGFLGIGIGAGAKIKELVLAGLFLFGWSAGYLFIPFEGGYTEGLLGSWAILGMALVAIYYHYRNLKKKRIKDPGIHGGAET